MRYLVRCGWHIGDILMQFPALRFLTSQGHQVYTTCLPEYRSLFELISYATWVERPAACRHDRYLDLQVHPNRLPALNKSRMSPLEFTYQLYEDIFPANRSHIVLDREPFVPRSEYGLPAEYNLISPFGHSQVFKPTLEWMVKKAVALMGSDLPIYILSERPLETSPFPVLTARNLSHIAPLIRNAKEFFTTNSSPSIFASVVRDRYYHLFSPDWRGTHDWKSPKQTVLYHEEWPLLHV